MINEIERIKKAKIIIQKIANGTNPINGLQIEDESLLQDPRIIRCFFYISDVLEGVINGSYSNKNITEFIITHEQKSKVIFTEGNIGINEVARCINEQINALISKKATGAQLNKGLKKLGILSEFLEDGKKKTTINEKSKNFGFFLEKRNFNGREYDMVLINDIGKKYIMDNIEIIME